MVQLEHDGERLLFDPSYTLHKKGFRPPDDELSKVKRILVTHGHIDHIGGIPEALNHCDKSATVYCTAKPLEVLTLKGVEVARLHKIAPGDVLDFDPFQVRVLKGKHVIYNKALVAGKVLNPRNLIYPRKLSYLLKENRVCHEAGETVVFEVTAADKRLLLLGSLNLDGETEYLEGVDLFVLPYQGRSDVCTYALQFVKLLKLKRVLLDHYDDSFPPISAAVDTEPFIALMRKEYPEIPVMCPRAGEDWISV